MVIDYLKEVHYKYIQEGIKADPKDLHRGTTAHYYFELIKNMGSQEKTETSLNQT